MCETKKCVVCGENCCALKCPDVHLFDVECPTTTLCTCRKDAAKWEKSGDCRRWLSSEEHLAIYKNAVEKTGKKGTAQQIFNISILAAFKLMKRESFVDRLLLFDVIQGAEKLLVASLDPTLEDEAVAISMYDRYKDDACRCRSFKVRRTEFGSEKAWDEQHISKRIENGFLARCKLRTKPRDSLKLRTKPRGSELRGSPSEGPDSRVIQNDDLPEIGKISNLEAAVAYTTSGPAQPPCTKRNTGNGSGEDDDTYEETSSGSGNSSGTFALTIVQKQLLEIQKQQGNILTMVGHLRKEHNDLYSQAVAYHKLHDRHQLSIDVILTFINGVNRSLDGQGGPNIA
ncbi:hypothetical protein VE04_02098 [Pseudogymnoascus sp. 24MN13]|nr:hypothetical protein VE04_02098 [Pseudogymnoascus sp. 24MN13]